MVSQEVMAEATQPQRAVSRSNPQAWEPDLEERGDGSWGSGQSQAMETQKSHSRGKEGNRISMTKTDTNIEF